MALFESLAHFQFSIVLTLSSVPTLQFLFLNFFSNKNAPVFTRIKESKKKEMCKVTDGERMRTEELRNGRRVTVNGGNDKNGGSMQSSHGTTVGGDGFRLCFCFFQPRGGKTKRGRRGITWPFCLWQLCVIPDIATTNKNLAYSQTWNLTRHPLASAMQNYLANTCGWRFPFKLSKICQL